MGLFTKTVEYLKEHLGKTRQKIASSLSAVLTLGRDINDDLLDQLEETLISDDIGVETTERLIEDLRGAYKKGQIKKTDDVLPFLKEQMKSCWPEQGRQLNIALSGPTVILVAGCKGFRQKTSIFQKWWLLNYNGKKGNVAGWR
ncbi:MAG: signal recognition particle receptor subunit alpha [Planctomycetes bacterium]|nr:signal recognition particle receptor subunit alpha [Planctomycetota bacterium]